MGVFVAISPCLFDVTPSPHARFTVPMRYRETETNVGHYSLLCFPGMQNIRIAHFRE